MKMVFAHDHYFYHVKGNVYSAGKLPYSSFRRYFNHFDSISVVSRYKEMDSVAANWSVSDGENIDFFKMENKSSLSGLFLKDKKRIDELYALIKNADGIVVRLPSEIGTMVAGIARELGKKYIAEVVACPWDAMTGYKSVKGYLYAPFLTLRTRLAVKNAWGAIYVTDNFLQQRYPNNRSIAASNVELLNSTQERLVKTHPKKAVRLGLIGSLDSPHKGFDTIYKALSVLANKNIDISLHIVGGGEKYKNETLLTELGITDKVFFLGNIKPGKDIYDFLDTTDIYVQPSNQEGLPRSVIEAMSRACPVVLSTAGGMPELVTSEYLHKPGDYESLADIIARLVEDESEFTRCVESSIKTAERFDSGKLAIKRYDFFKSYCDGAINNG
ncbi:glycosyltransferase family 4 protein [Buttiauxella gaviniae]|uniref:glycosyltransferase family 4 protein n=1 Tax=Buttiauxella gaviniae TaxID=82990 RepID=UPI003BB49456